MDPNFNYSVAADLFDEISKMDDDTAEMFIQAVNFDLLTNDLYNNRQFVAKACQEILEEIRAEVAPSLVARSNQEALVAASLVGLVTKSDHWKKEPRDKKGQWTASVSFQRNKSSQPFNVTDALKTVGQETNAFAEKWQKRGSDYDDAFGHGQTYNRIQAGSRVAGLIGGPKVTAAAQLGQQVGKYGPEAEKVVGPTVRRTAYRYRGTERTPDTALIREYRDQRKSLWGEENVPFTSPGDTALRTEASRSAAISYLEGRLPKQNLAALQAASGKIPPSEGVIINADGKIITQAVGYNEDHYLPFNLKNLKGLKGGSYVRTRSSGGLTTEDIYTGLMSGARQITVVSRSGVFTMDFDDTFRGGRRYNDKAVQMIKQYGKTLDAVKSKTVDRTAPVTMTEKAEIRDEVESAPEWQGATQGEIEDEITQRIKDFRVSTVPTKIEMEKIDRAALEAASGAPIKTSSTVGVTDRAVGGVGGKQEMASPDLKKRYSYYRSQLIDELRTKKESRQYQLDGEGYAVAMDALQEQFPYYIGKVNYAHKRSENLPKDKKYSAETDTGYVKPRYNRPQGASEGYFDPSINGMTKISADQTAYQNWRNNPANRGQKAEVAAEGEEAATPKDRKAQLKAQNKAMGVARVQNLQDAQLKSLIGLYARTTADPEGLPILTSLADSKSSIDLDALLLNRVKRDAVINELERHDAAVAAAGANKPQSAEANLHRQAAVHWRAFHDAEDALGGQEFDEKTWQPGTSLKIPYDFTDRAHGAAPPIAEEMDDKGLRAVSELYGTMYNVFKDGKQLDDDGMNIVYRKLAALPDGPTKENASLVIQRTMAGDIPQLKRGAAVARQHALNTERLRSRLAKEAQQNKVQTLDTAAIPPPEEEPKAPQMTRHELAKEIERSAIIHAENGDLDSERKIIFLAEAVHDGSAVDVQIAFQALGSRLQKDYRQSLLDQGINV